MLIDWSDATSAATAPQKLLHFIQQRVNPIGFAVNDKGRHENEIFEDGYEKSIDYIIDNEDYEDFEY